MESLSTLFHLFLDEEPCYCYLQHFGLTKWSARQGLKVFPPPKEVHQCWCVQTCIWIFFEFQLGWLSAQAARAR